MKNSLLRNRALIALAFLTFHITIIWLPISISYPHWFISWITLGKVEIHALSDWGTLVRLVLLSLNIASFTAILKLMRVKGHRTRLFRINYNGIYPTLIISSLYGAVWNIIYIVILIRSASRMNSDLPDLPERSKA